ncbi:hypothetical protein K493DRAFT_373193 [Basidiobolus meristosporus CBS 931.73]|uniref:Sushi domain-containing protein n=1 Tax=Basidiobolus meristosporus CBS 931.73 TaxID=1314790 RepID=A0A1Y1VSJ2_9FUNG|nr:hypothetical protein K493DRAFT_368538 [Basidiobolus meristosporus CBS 931.73]ORX94846.1 hypothetical protein K493DRAFT_373189 [Basidiobolus meristosporus CBS 931.73]ORX94847.1 hypothetical protein K493DRAFT_373193 [Basidiobolus meristosporus CBS 931.73]|eukprot:ORX64272.1 hypothetical protein K493DRAFT_368538 [Basidiobolus meristosporus CBS 931.73]
MRLSLTTIVSLCLLVGLGAEAAPHCSKGEYQCSGNSFLQCDNGRWVTKQCGPGTRCVQKSQTSVYCDYDHVAAASIERRAPSECKPGAYKCTGKGFLQCANGSWVRKECGRGTKCVQNGPNAVYCDYSAKVERRAPHECKPGAYKCSGQGFLQCDNGKWVHKRCGAGTSCVQNGPNAVYCDYAKKGSHHGLEAKTLLSSSHGSGSGSRGECRPGTYQCAGQGFRQCDNGKWVHKDCGPGTACVQNGDYAVYCDYAKLA